MTSSSSCVAASGSSSTGRQPDSVYNTVNNPPFTRNVTVRYGQLQNLSSTGLTTEAPPSLMVWQVDQPLPSSTQWNTGVQMTVPFKSVLDIAYTGQHSWGFVQQVNINAIDYGAAFLPQYQDPDADERRARSGLHAGPEP